MVSRRKGTGKTLTLRLSEEMDHAVYLIAKVMGKSKNDIIRQAIREYLDKRKDENR